MGRRVWTIFRCAKCGCMDQVPRSDYIAAGLVYPVTGVWCRWCDGRWLRQVASMQPLINKGGCDA